MSEISDTQPTKITGETAPTRIKEETPPPPPSETPEPAAPAPKKRRGRFWLAALILILLLAVGGGTGYMAGSKDRIGVEATTVSAQMKDQFQKAALDMAQGKYDQARQRLEFIISKDPNFPGVTDALTEVMLKLSITPTVTPTITPSLTPTPDMRGVQSIYDRANQLVAASDWTGALQALDELRKTDPNFQTANVDGMYYISLRNLGVDQLTREGKLESGIYSLTLAERFGPIDGYAGGLRDGARLYLTGASFWELDWDQAIQYFTQVYQAWPSLWDSASGMTASERLFRAYVFQGDAYAKDNKFCRAEQSYMNALSIKQDAEVNNKAIQAGNTCHPPIPTETPDPNITPTTSP